MVSNEEIMKELYESQKDGVISIAFMGSVYIVTIGIAFWSVYKTTNNISWSLIGLLFQGFHVVIYLIYREKNKKLDARFKKYFKKKKTKKK